MRDVRANTSVRLDRSADYVDDVAPRPRQGKACPLTLSKAAFRIVISSRACLKAHSGAFEAQAVTLSLCCVLRSVRRHSRRTVFLVDATAVCGAVAKGRCSSPTMKHEIKHIAALAIAGDLWVRVVYIPSKDNPKDAPSRGVVRA